MCLWARLYQNVLVVLEKVRNCPNKIAAFGLFKIVDAADSQVLELLAVLFAVAVEKCTSTISHILRPILSDQFGEAIAVVEVIAIKEEEDMEVISLVMAEFVTPNEAQVVPE